MDYCCQILLGMIPLVVLVAFFGWILRHKEVESEGKSGRTSGAASEAEASQGIALHEVEEPRDEDEKPAAYHIHGSPLMPSADTILACEFEYARVTASESVEDRARMINFYFAIFGVSVTGALAIQQGGVALPAYTGTALLWTLYVLGWIYFLILIQLRKAWFQSVKTMNWMKKYFLEFLKNTPISTDVSHPAPRLLLERAFRWDLHSMPAPGRRFTVFFYSNLLVAVLSSHSYAGGLAFLIWEQQPRASGLTLWAPAAVLGLLSIFIQMYFWQRMLQEGDSEDGP